MKLGRIDKETTSNIGIIKGGAATNIVPEKVVIKGEARSHDIKKVKSLIKHMEKMVLDACKANKAKAEIKIHTEYEAFNVDERSILVQTILSSAKKAGLTPTVKSTGGGSDANIFNKFDIPCLILGVGMHNVHTSLESLSINDLVNGTNVILESVKLA